MTTDIRHQFTAFSHCSKLAWLDLHKPSLRSQIRPQYEQPHLALIDVAAQRFDGLVNCERDEERSLATLDSHQGGYALQIPFPEFSLYVDLMIPGDQGWNLVMLWPFPRVRNKTLREAAMQTVLLKEHYPIHSVTILSVRSHYYRKESLDPFQLFDEHHVTDDVMYKTTQVASALNGMHHVLRHEEEPNEKIGLQCVRPMDCMFKRYCWSHLPKPSVFDLSGLPIKRKLGCYHHGVIELEDVKKKERLNSRQKEQIEVHFSGKDIVKRDELSTFLGQLSYPLTFLDFEAVQAVIPPFPGTVPYQQVPFQFSAHIQEEKGAPLTHHEFLADLRQDPREAFCNALVEAIPSSGSVIVYGGGFEHSVIQGLAKFYPQHASALLGMDSRIIDLITPFEQRIVFTKSMHGSLSFKDILPALVPECSYSSMTIANGEMVSRASEHLLYTDNQDDIDVIQAHLKTYCRQDTYGMARLVEYLYSLLD